MKMFSILGAALLFSAAGAWAQGRAETPAPPTDTAQPPTQAEPPSASQPEAPVASSSKTISGTVESLVEGKSMKVKTAEGKTKSFNLRTAAVDPSVKVGSAVRVTQSRDVNGKSSLTVEPDQSEKK